MSESNQQSQPYREDVIDLRDLILILIDGWYWIVGVTIVAVLGALAYVSTKTPTYETEFKAVHAPAANFSGFSLLGNGFSISPEDAYRNLGNHLSSYHNFETFYEEHREKFVVGEDVDVSRLFASRFSVNGLQPERGEIPTLTLEYNYSEGEAGSEIVNAYVQETARIVWEKLRGQFHEYNRAQIARLETELELQKESLRSAREDRLFALDQAITVARRLEIEKPTTPQQFGRQPSGSEVIYANINGDGSLPLYFMGYQALEADRDTLKAAINEGLSNVAIRNTEQELKRHKRIAELLDNESLSGVDQGVGQSPAERVVQVVEYAYEPAGPSGPRKALILVLSVVLGGMFGVFLVVVIASVGNLRRYRQNKQGGLAR